MKSEYQHIISGIEKGKTFLAVLIDPDKMAISNVPAFINKINHSSATHILVGGSEVNEGITDNLVQEIKKFTDLPIIIFPGDEMQLTAKADCLLFLSLLSGRNPEYLIGKHIEAVPKLNAMGIEVIPTGYILIENGKQTSVERVSNTKPIPRSKVKTIVNTAKAGEYLGMKFIYLEAGSGALHPIDAGIITSVKEQLNIPLIVGGGIRTKEALIDAYNAGADIVVIGTAIEENNDFLNKL